MKTIFVSHDNRDKLAIRPYVQALLDDGFVIFIDRPVEAGLDPSHPRIRHILMDETYRKTLPQALTISDFVLLFWTLNSVEGASKPGVLLQEIYSADYAGKLRCVVLAANDAEALLISNGLSNFKIMNMPQYVKFVGVTGRVADHASYVSLRDQMLGRLRSVGMGDLVPEMIAKLVDRGRPVQHFKTAALTVLTECCSGDRRCRALVVVGHQEDCTHHVDERFTEFDGRDTFDLLEPADAARAALTRWGSTRQWNRCDMHVLEIPGMQKDEFTTELKRRMADLKRKRPLRGKDSRYPLVPTVSVREEHIRDDLEGNIAAWMQIWNDELATPTDIPVLPVLRIEFVERAGWLSSLIGRDPVKRTVKATVRAAERFDPRRLEIKVVSEFSRIGWADALGWAEAYVPEQLRGDVDALVDVLFPEAERGWRTYSMYDFYNSVITSPAFGGRAA